MARNTWSDGENTKYMAAYEEAMKQGLDQREKFEYISSKLSHRSPQVCNGHWLNALDPERSTGPWTSADDDLLAENVARLGTAWTEIAKSFKGRTPNMCKNRYYGEARKSERKDRSRSRSRTLPKKTKTEKNKSSAPLQSSLEILTEAAFANSSPVSLTMHSSAPTLSTDQTLASFAFSSPSITIASSSFYNAPPLDASDDESLGDTSWLNQV